MRIVVVNDDGIRSLGLKLLYESVKGLGEATIVTPMEPTTARGGTLTLDEPIGVYEVDLGYAVAYSITGSPRDSIHVAREVVLDSVDLLVAGVNVGENTSIQNILVSGTVGAATEAALFGIPAIAFSADVNEEDAFLDSGYATSISAVVRAVASYVMESGMPGGADILSVNLPRKFSGVVRVVPLARLRWLERLDRRVDPRGRPYFWLYGEAAEPEPGTDSYVVFVERGVAITPLKLDFAAVSGEEVDKLAGAVSAAVRGFLR